MAAMEPNVGGGGAPELDELDEEEMRNIGHKDSMQPVQDALFRQQSAEYEALLLDVREREEEAARVRARAREGERAWVLARVPCVAVRRGRCA